MFLNLGGHFVKKKDVYFQYSNAEQFTGKYWIDGKKIYCKVIPVNFNTKTVHGISGINYVIRADLYWYDTTDKRWFFNQKDTYDYHVIYNGTDETHCIVKCMPDGYDWQIRTSNRYIILEYTKTTD